MRAVFKRHSFAKSLKIRVK